MHNAIIFHGTSSTPDAFWQPYIKNELEQRHYDVWIPALPHADTPDLKYWLPVALEGKYTKETVIIAHSSGCPLVISLLEKLTIQVKKVILVAGYARPKGEKKESEAILQTVYDWEKIRQNVKELYSINSDNDPWGCTDVEGKYIFDHLGGTLIIKHGEGHMGSNLYKQPYKEFPLLVKLIEL